MLNVSWVNEHWGLSSSAETFFDRVAGLSTLYARPEHHRWWHGNKSHLSDQVRFPVGRHTTPTRQLLRKLSMHELTAKPISDKSPCFTVSMELTVSLDSLLCVFPDHRRLCAASLPLLRLHHLRGRRRGGLFAGPGADYQRPDPHGGLRGP